MTSLALSLVVALSAADPSAAEGVWVHAEKHALDLPIRWVAPATEGVVVVSDLERTVVGVRVDSGLVAWSRKLTGVRGVWVVDDVVVVSAGELVGFHADVGTRLWSRPMGCPSATDACDARVVDAGAVGLWVADGGPVQGSVARLDPQTGQPLWAAPASVAHARRLVSPSRDPGAAPWVAVEEGQAPFTIRFLEPGTGRELGAWTRRVAGIARPCHELVGHARLGLIAVDARPGDGSLAHVFVVAPDGSERTTRRIPRDGRTRNQVVWVGAGDQALALFVPDPGAGGGQLVSLDLAEPWTATSTTLTSWSQPLAARGYVVMPPPPTGEAPPMVSALLPGTADAAWSRRIAGLGADVATIVAGGELVVVDRLPIADGAGLVTLSLTDGAVHGIGSLPAPAARAEGGVVAARAGDMLIVGQGRELHRLAWLGADEVRARLARGAAAGQDPTPILRRLARFGALAEGLAEAPGPREERPEPRPAPPTSTLDATDAQTLDAFAATWATDTAGTIEGLRDLIDRADPLRRAGVLEGSARLVLAQVLATGQLPRSEEARSGLVALARAFEPSASSQTRASAALWAALMQRLDEPLAAADILGRARGEPALDRAYGEAAQRAVRGIRTSAGALTTTTQREMLVAGLRFFRHLEVVLGPSADRAAELMDLAAGSPAAGKELAALVAASEGAAAARAGIGPELCALACEAAAATCPIAVDVARCAARCVKSQAVRFTERARPSLARRPGEAGLPGSPGRDDAATWYCGP
ncbi:MAG: PQQ-like beta-propeller repeat protein [Deltaproteobacteria bacterium]|nr:PQQ-like beta-propeller repeat protein [Deltaproteobacteria bacterium]